VDRKKINNDLFMRHTTQHEQSLFTFRSAWSYCGTGEKKSLKLSIEKTSRDATQRWDDEHSMVALSFDELLDSLQNLFEVHVFEHDYEKIRPWNKSSGNAIFACVKI
tara:strand:- start:2054 stop:2374 length:321 start_codon:yes stop_codon:yes gene_type:complete